MQRLFSRYFKYILIIAIILSMGAVLSMKYLKSQGIHELIQEISVLLNHQDVESARILYKEIQAHDDITTARDLSYQEFLARLRLLPIMEFQDDFLTRIDELSALRKEYFPEEETNAALLLTRGDDQFLRDCKGKEQIIVDSIDIGQCLLRKKQSNADDKEQIRNLIKKLYTPTINSSDTQSMSDLGILIGMYLGLHPEQEFSDYARELGKKITEIDPHFVNGYLLLITYETDDSMKQAAFEQLKQNYTGDKNQYDSLMPGYVRAFNLR